MAIPEADEDATPIYGIRQPKPTRKAFKIWESIFRVGQDVEAALLAFGLPPVVGTTPVVAASIAARDSHWGIPSNSTERLALQQAGAMTLRTDTGKTERYYAELSDGGSNPGGKSPAGWYDIGGGSSSRVVPTAATNGSVLPGGVVTSSSVALVRVRDAFPPSFRVFRVNYDAIASAASGISFRLAAAAVDNTGSSYDSERQQILGAVAIPPAQSLAAISGELSAVGVAGARHVGSVLISSPNLADQTFWTGQAVVSLPTGMTGSTGMVLNSGVHRPSAAFDSLTLFCGAGNITINRLTVEGVS